MTTARMSGRELAIFAWAFFGVCALITQAITRLTPLALEPIVSDSLTPLQAACYAAWVVFNTYAEGYRGFHKAWAPRVVVRTLHIARHPKALHVVLAPLIAMGLVHASRRRLLMSWLLCGMIVLVVAAMRFVPQPYRGIVDGGVVAGLSLGLLSLVLHFGRALFGTLPMVEADFPLEVSRP